MKIVALHSGGMDSSVLVAHLCAAGHDVDSLGVNYGQRHVRELDYAQAFAKHYGVRRDVVDFRALAPLLAESGSSLVSAVGVPEGHYADESMKVTVVPNRNMLLIAAAGAVAIARKASAVAFAAHAGDHTIYPDCRPEFAAAADATLALADWHVVTALRPFVTWSKADVARRGAELGVPFELTWSCYNGRDRHCGRCGTCFERREAFEVAGVTDPTEYEL